MQLFFLNLEERFEFFFAFCGVYVFGVDFAIVDGFHEEDIGFAQGSGEQTSCGSGNDTARDRAEPRDELEKASRDCFSDEGCTARAEHRGDEPHDDAFVDIEPENGCNRGDHRDLSGDDDGTVSDWNWGKAFSKSGGGRCRDCCLCPAFF